MKIKDKIIKIIKEMKIEIVDNDWRFKDGHPMVEGKKIHNELIDRIIKRIQETI